MYVVAWPDGVWKVGYTVTHRRWMQFVDHGAQLVELTEFEDAATAFRYEKIRARSFAPLSEPAFSSADQSRRYLGGRGAGWTECFRIDADIVDWSCRIDYRILRSSGMAPEDFALTLIACSADDFMDQTSRDLDGLEFWERGRGRPRGPVWPLCGADWDREVA